MGKVIGVAGGRPLRMVVAAMVLSAMGLALAGCGQSRQWESWGEDSPKADATIPGSRPCQIEVVVSTVDPGSMVSFQAKDVDIWISDEDDGKKLLHDELTFGAGALDADFTWEEWGEVTVRLIEKGNSLASDPYNRALLADGPRGIVTLVYRYQADKDEFVRVKVLPGADVSEPATPTPSSE